MFQSIRKLFKKMVSVNYSERACEGWSWRIWIYAPWRKEGSFSGKIFGFSLEVEDKQQYLYSIENRKKHHPNSKAPKIVRGFMVKIQLGNGAGYRWGRTAWITNKPKGYKMAKIGLTQNANIIPTPGW